VLTKYNKCNISVIVTAVKSVKSCSQEYRLSGAIEWHRLLVVGRR